MKIKKYSIALLGTFLFITAAAPCSTAQETTGDYVYEMGTKFGRGLENVVTSLGDIPCTMIQDVKDDGSMGLVTGLGMGTVYMLRRILVGVTEVATFVIPAERTIPKVCHRQDV